MNRAHEKFQLNTAAGIFNPASRGTSSPLPAHMKRHHPSATGTHPSPPFSGRGDTWGELSSDRTSPPPTSLSLVLDPDPEGLRDGVDEWLNNASGQYSQDNWDGEGAKAVSPEVLARVRDLVRQLPRFLELPELDASSLGDLHLDWAASNEDMLAVTLGADGSVHFALLLRGNESYRGSIPWTGDLPPMLSFCFEEMSAAEERSR